MDPDQNSLDQPTAPVPQFPRGVPTIDPRQAKPLMKLMNRMMHPRPKIKTHNWKKKHKYY